MRELLERMGWIDRTTTHGIREDLGDRAHELSARSRSKVCLSHVQGDPLERAYQRGDIIEKRRQLMQAWTDYCETGEGIEALNNMVPLRA